MVESKGAPYRTMRLASYSVSQPRKVSILRFNGFWFDIAEHLLYVVWQGEGACVQLGVVVTGVESEGVPADPVDVFDGVAVFRGKAEEPVARRIRRDVGLVDAAYGEGIDDAFVGALHGVGILGVEGAFVLVDHDAVVVQGLVAVAVEFLGEEAFAGAEGVSRVDDDEVVGVFAVADEFEAVFVVDGEARVAEAAGGLRQVFAADFDDEFVDFDEVDVFDGRVAQKFADGAAVAAADDEDAPGVGIDAHGDVRDHFVVDEFVFFGEHHVAVKGQEAAEFARVEDVDALEFAFAGVELAIYFDGEFDVFGVVFGEPEFHIGSFRRV